MSTEKRKDATIEAASAANPDQLVQATPEAALELTDEQLSQVSGGQKPLTVGRQRPNTSFGAVVVQGADKVANVG